MFTSENLLTDFEISFLFSLDFKHNTILLAKSSVE